MIIKAKLGTSAGPILYAFALSPLMSPLTIAERRASNWAGLNSKDVIALISPLTSPQLSEYSKVGFDANLCVNRSARPGYPTLNAITDHGSRVCGEA